MKQLRQQLPEHLQRLSRTFSQHTLFTLPLHTYVRTTTTSQVAAKKLDRRLSALGAAALLERGLGDDQVMGG